MHPEYFFLNVARAKPSIKTTTATKVKMNAVTELIYSRHRMKKMQKFALGFLHLKKNKLYYR